jgi:CubicO group peptidase (beta-lactamase class C family)
MELHTVRPEAAGMSSEQLAKARQHAQQVGDQLGAPGGAVLVVRHDQIVGEWYWGTRGAGDDRPFNLETMIPLCSVTKGLTATALSLLIQDGTLWLDEPAYLHIPELNLAGGEFKEGSKAQITVRHLATHSSGMPAGDPDFYGAWRDRQADEHPYEAYVRHALMRDLAYAPGTSHIYSDPAVCLLGEVIYRASGQRVPDLMRERVFQPLGLERIGWDFDDELAEDIGLLVQNGWNRSRTGTKEARQDGSLWGGLISNARDLATFGLVLLHEGDLDGVRVLAPLTVRMMTSCQMPLPARPRYPHRGLFWWIKAAPDSPELGHIVRSGTYCHGGAAHSVLVVMPALDIVAVKLCNRVGSPPGFIYARDYPVFMDLVAASVDEL